MLCDSSYENEHNMSRELHKGRVKEMYSKMVPRDVQDVCVPRAGVRQHEHQDHQCGGSNQVTEDLNKNNQESLVLSIINIESFT